MAYLGNVPARSFINFERQVFTIVNSQTAYTLSHSVTNENDIRLVVNNVVQEPGSGKAYTASGTTLTLSAALTNGTDEMYCVFLGRAVGTVNAPAASVGNSQTAPTIITGQTAETSIATDDLILLSDTSASGALRKMTRANFVSGVGGTNTPYFYGELPSNQTISRGVFTQVTGLTQNELDSASAFDGTTFTVPSGQGGKYYLEGVVTGDYQSIGEDGENTVAVIRKNGSNIKSAKIQQGGTQNMREVTVTASGIFTLSASDTIQLYAYLLDASGGTADVQSDRTSLMGYKIIE